MNAPILRFRGPATQAAQAMNQKLNEIEANVRNLQTQAKLPPIPTETIGEENSETEAAGDSNVATGNAPATVSSVTGAPAAALAEISNGAAAPESLPPANPVRPENGQRWPAVPDLRPDLAALTGALQQQHAATAQALQSVTALCRKQAADLALLSQEFAALTNRMNVMSRSR